MLQLFVCVLCVLSTFFTSTHCAGTTLGIKEVFIGRCWQYQSVSPANKIPELKFAVNCTNLWQSFHDSFAYKDPCNVTHEDYRPFFEMLRHPKKLSNSLFWSGLHDLISDFSYVNDQYIVLEDTMTGYLLNNLAWCGSTTAGINYTSCSQECDATYYAWVWASSEFAKRASGTARVLLNATRANKKDAYANGSFFRTVEMPRLKADKLVVLLASSIGQAVRESCNDSPSMDNIRRDAKTNSIEVECIDQPSLVLNVYCLKYPKAKECTYTNQALQSEMKSSQDEARKWEIVGVVFCSLFAALLCAVTFWIVKLRFSPNKKNRSVEMAVESDTKVISNPAVVNNHIA